MSSRLLIAYLLIVLLAGGLAYFVWHAIYNSEDNVRRRDRRARRARRKALQGGADEEGNSVDDNS